MKHLVIIPAYNEEENLERIIESLASQTKVPERVVIVDDGSSDATPQILERYCLRYDWLSVATNKNKDKRATGAKIVRAFNLGLDSVSITDYDIVSKFDADLEFPPDYILRIETSLKSDKAIGLTGAIT